MDITASSITFVTSAYSAYGLIKKIKDLPKEFDEVENRLPLARNTLAEFQKILGFEGLDVEAKEAIEKILMPCQANAKKLKAIFEGIQKQKHNGENGLSRYRIVVLKMGKASRVEVLLQGIMMSLEQLAINHEARMANLLPKLSDAVAALSKTKSSVPDEDFKPEHASQYNASGATGHQTFNNVTGGQTNNSGGTIYSTNTGAMHINSGPDLRERRNAVLRQLDKIAYRAAKDRNRRPTEGTCRWVVEHDVFEKWKSDTSSALLWLSADPGCGKSVLARHLVDSVLADHGPCYFFFKDGYSGQTTADSALGCILHQLLAAREDLLSEDILCRFEVSSQIYQSAEDLWDVLERVARAIGSQIICVLDAFDECKDEDSTVLAGLLRHFYARRSAASNIKFLVTSRPYHNIKHKFRIEDGVSIIHLNGETPEETEKIAEEIDIFMESEIAEMKQDGHLSAGDADSLRTWMHRVTNRTYLWAHLVLSEISHRPGEHFATVLSELPKTVNDAYEKMLRRTTKVYDRKQVAKLLHIVLAATRPLSIDEMYIALAINKQHQRHADIGSPGNGFDTYIRELCGLFVYIVDSKVHLFHQTAREFLVPAQGARHPLAEDPVHWQHSLDSKVSNLVLYETCAWYLLLTDADPEVNDKDATTQLTKMFNTHKFYEYCATSWAHHYRCSETCDLDLSLALLPPKRDSTGSAPGRPWLAAYWKLKHGKPTDESFTPLIAASYFGLLNVVRHITRTSTRGINKVESGSRRSALSFAAENGFTKVVSCLLSINREVPRRFLYLRRLDINSGCSEGQTPLIYAASNGHADTVRLLIDAGAKTDVRDRLEQTALSYALAYGHSEVVKKLAGKESVDDVSAITQRLMFKAVEINGFTIVTRLLANGADVDGRDIDGNTPLLVAIRKDNHDMVRLLLDNGARPDVPDAAGFTPYYWALPIVPFMLSKADSRSVFAYSMARTILEHLDPADFTKYSDPRQLLSTKTPSYIRDNVTSSAFVGCCLLGYDQIATQLLNCHSDPSLFFSSGMRYLNDNACFYKLLREKMAMMSIHTRTELLRKALRSENETAAEYLINSGVDLEERDGEGRTVIFDALMLGPNILQMLIKAGASTTSRDYWGSTPLHKAVSGSPHITRIILENGAEINAKDNDGRTPLLKGLVYWNWHWGSRNPVELLLEYGADIEAKTRSGQTGLEMTIKHCDRNMLKCLLKGGADANAVVSTGQSPLQYVRRGHGQKKVKEIERLLKAYGATDG